MATRTDYRPSARGARTRPTSGHYDRSLLPSPAEYYRRELGALRGSGAWKSALCPFHEDATPSLSVKLETGAYHCHACGEKGGDVLAFHMAKHGQGFVDAAKALGAWTEERRHG